MIGKRLAVIGTVALLLLSGCSDRPRSETHVIDSKANRLPSEGEYTPFDVQSIYKVLEDQEGVTPLGWTDRQTLLVHKAAPDRSELATAGFPFDSALKLRPVSVRLPGGDLPASEQWIALLREAEGHAELRLVPLHSLQAESERTIADIREDQVPSLHCAWSGNGQYFGYIVPEPGRGRYRITVHDTGTNAEEAFEYAPDGAAVPTVLYIGDDGAQAAVVVRNASGSFSIEYGTLEQKAFTLLLRHDVSRTSSVEWAGAEQLMFIGSDFSLYIYDRRNGQISAILQGVALFDLSPDGKYVAYAGTDNAVRAAMLYGHNTRANQLVYRGMLASRLIWSPDGRQLLLSGRKSYASDASQAMQSAPVAEEEQHQVIVFQS